ncbi:MAG: hypothetical protein JWN81_2674, partial [Solirubrobacterales bacterium]|nr:hypothetical protein [Solirubrobacterales bacterium]
MKEGAEVVSQFESERAECFAALNPG